MQSMVWSYVVLKNWFGIYIKRDLKKQQLVGTCSHASCHRSHFGKNDSSHRFYIN